MDSGAYFAYGKRNDPGDETLFKSIYKNAKSLHGSNTIRSE